MKIMAFLTMATTTSLTQAVTLVQQPSRDTSIFENRPDDNNGTGESLQSNPTGLLANDQTYILLDWDAVAAGVIDSANLEYTLFDFAPSGGSLVFQVYGLTGEFDENTATWNNALSLVDTATSYASLNLNFTTPGDLGQRFSLDLTNAVTALQAGSIQGIAIGLDGGTSEFNGTSERFSIYSKEAANPDFRPELRITYVPEPTSLVMISLGCSLLTLRRKRRDKSLLVSM